MNFRELRKLSGMSVPEFAKYFEITYRTVASWEAGERNCPTHLLKLMEYKLKKEGIIEDKNDGILS